LRLRKDEKQITKTSKHSEIQTSASARNKKMKLSYAATFFTHKQNVRSCGSIAARYVIKIQDH